MGGIIVVILGLLLPWTLISWLWLAGIPIYNVIETSMCWLGFFCVFGLAIDKLEDSINKNRQ